MEFPFLGFGVGLRTKHYSTIVDDNPAVDWFEVISENFMVPGGRPLYILEKIRSRYPIVLHGVSLSIGATDPLSDEYLGRLKDLARRFEPQWISDHLCWSGTGGDNAHDLLPLPYTPETVMHVAERVQRVQDFLGCRILLENVSTYLEFTDSTMPEWDFLAAVAEQADCGILLDINNIFVNAFNHCFSATRYLEAVPVNRVHQFHIAGHTDRGSFLHDTHDHAVADPVWDLYEQAVRRFGRLSTLVEWDDHIPDFRVLHAEALHAKALSARFQDADAQPNTNAAVETDYRA